MPIFSRHTLDAASWLEKMIDPSDTPVRKKALSWVLVFVSYLLTAQIGIYLYRDIGTSPALIWPPVGIALAAVLLEGYWIWSAIALAALANGILAGSPALILAGSVIANTVQPLVGGYVLRRLHFNSLMNTLRDVFLLISVALICTAIMPLMNFCFALLNNRLFDATRPLQAWPTIWIGGALSALVLTPFLSRWIGRDISNRTRLQQLEMLVSVTAVAILSYLLFATPITGFYGTTILLILIGALFWIAFRVGPRAMSLALLVMTAISIAGTMYGIHAPSPSQQTLAQRLISTEMFDLIFAFFFFLLVSVEEQRKEAIKNLNQDAARLESALETIRSEDRAKNDFIATLAHELRNPLAPVMSGLELLGMSERDPERLEIIASAKRQSLVMRRLLDELLDVARVTQRTFTLHKEEVSLQSVITQSIQTTQHFFKEREHSFESSMDPEPLWVKGDPVRLTQVFTNILYNAGKYTEPGGKIRLTLRQAGAEASIEVQDSGIGIPENMLSRIFEPFVQDNRHIAVGTGLGIGLSIAKRMVEMHEGTITARSAGRDQGSVFSVRLPIVKPHSASEPKPSQVKMRRTSILIVDDNRDAADSMAKLLRMHGHTIRIAHSGKEALEKLSEKPEAVLLDIGLPDIDGHEVAMQIRKLEPKCKIVALSGFASGSKGTLIERSTIDAHITKPASLSDIETTLEELLR